MRAGIVVVILTALLLSLSSIFSRFSYNAGSNPQTLLLLRFLAFCILSAIVLIASRESFSWQKKLYVPTFLAGIFYAAGSGSLLASMFFLPVSLAIVIFYTYPVMTLLGIRILDKKQPCFIEVLCFIVAFFGLVLAVNVSGKSFNSTGLSFAFTASAGMSACYLICDRKLNTIPSMKLTFHMALTGLILSGFFVILSRSFELGNLDLKNQISISSDTFCFALAFFFMFKGISLIGAVSTSMILNLEPVLTVALSVIMLNESLFSQQIIGATMVISAITFLQCLKTSPV